MKNKIKSQKFDLFFTMMLGVLISTNLFAQQDELQKKAKYGDIDAVKALIEAGTDINCQDESTGYTPLMWACEFHYTEMAKMLIEMGADLNIRAIDGSTALIRAAGNAPEVVESLILKGADIESVTEEGMGVLLQAAFGILYKGYTLESVTILLDHGADIEEAFVTPEDIAGYTPLMFAARDNHEELAKLLINKGANANARGENGKTPLALAEENGYTAMVELLKANGGK